jgi:hypothetical protein
LRLPDIAIERYLRPATDATTLSRVASSDIASASGIFKIKNSLFTFRNLRYIVLAVGAS